MTAYKYVEINCDLGMFGGTLRKFELTKRKGEDRTERQQRKFRLCVAAVRKYIEGSIIVTAAAAEKVNSEGSLVRELICEF